MKQFIAEFGESFTEHMKDRLLDLEVRCVLTRNEEENIVDIKHVEHTKYKCGDDSSIGEGKTEKEYSYGQFIILDENLLFSRQTAEGAGIMESPIVDTIYKALTNEEISLEDGSKGKKVDDSNIDFVIDSMLTVCPQVSQSYIDIVQGMIARSNR